MTTLTEPRLPHVLRVRLPPEARRTIPARQAGWALAQGVVACVLVLAGLAASAPVIAFGAALAVGLAAAHPRRLLRAPLIAVLILAAGVAGDYAGVSPVLSAGAATGVGAAWLGAGNLTPWRALHGGLALTAATGLGWWTAHVLVPSGLDPQWTSALRGAVTGLVAAQGLWVVALRWSSVDRIPSPQRIKSTLTPPYQEPSLRAWQLDAALARSAPDRDTRDGLGEVAAWVYRLSWSLQAIDRDREGIAGDDLDARLGAAREAVLQTTDDTVRERRDATVRHLELLARHRESLGLERERTAALMDYALAFLEQARAGLALSRLQPGENTPERLTDVLGRLRAHTVEGDARRRTARQLTPLA